MTSLLVGQQAPDFELLDQHGRPTRLSSFRGASNVVVMFYPFAFTPVCARELAALRDEHDEFARAGAAVLSISCDSIYTLRAYADREGIEHPLLSDFWPHGAVASAYDVLDGRKGIARRATFVIDRDGVIRWIVESEGERSTADYLAALARIP